MKDAEDPENEPKPVPKPEKSKELALKDKSKSIVAKASKQEVDAMELTKGLVQNQRSKPVKETLTTHIERLQKCNKELMQAVTTPGIDHDEHKKLHNALVSVMNKFVQYKSEAKPHLKKVRDSACTKASAAKKFGKGASKGSKGKSDGSI